MELLTDDGVTAELASVPGWTRSGGSITCTATLADFRAAMLYAGAVAYLAEDANHHPDILIQWTKAPRRGAVPWKPGVSRYTRCVRVITPCYQKSLCSECTGQALDAVDETGQQPVGRAGGADIRDTAQQLAEHDGDLAPGQMRAQAEMRSRGTEPDMGVGRAGDVEPCRVGEYRFVLIG